MTASAPPAAPGPFRAAVRATCAQLPVVATVGLLWGATLLHLVFANLVAEQTPWSQRLAVAGGLAALLAFEVALVSTLGLALELAFARWRAKGALDAVKAAALAGAFAVVFASLAKFRLSSVHLKTTDLWFAYANFRQIVAEARLGEAAALVGFPVGVLVLAGLLWWALARARRARRIVPPATLPILLVASGALLAGLHRGSPALGQLTSDFIPETHWLGRLVEPHRFGPPAAGAAAEAAVSGWGPAIEPYRPPRAIDRPDVVLVMLESIPWKRTLLADPPAAAATPNLARLAAESVVFDRAYTTSTHSDYAQMAILSSLHPRKYDSHDYYLSIDYPRTLIWDALAPAGYTTAMFSCQNERWGNMLNYLDTPGLDVLRHSLDWPRARHRGRGSSSKVYEETPVDEWRRWLEARDPAPYLAYLNFQATHFPYEAPPEAPRPFSPHAIDFAASYLDYPPEKVPVMLNRFANALLYADRYLGEVVAELERRGTLDRTILVVVSDHGEAFYEHGQPTHGTTLHEEQVRSLLAIRAPGLAPRRVDQPVSLLDVAPAIVALAGLPPHGNFQGRGDIVDPAYDAAGRPLFFTIQGMTGEDGLLLDGWKYVVNWDRRFRRLHELATDPDERTDLSADLPAETDRLHRLLAGFIGRQTAYYSARGWEAGRYPPRLP